MMACVWHIEISRIQETRNEAFHISQELEIVRFLTLRNLNGDVPITKGQIKP